MKMAVTSLDCVSLSIQEDLDNCYPSDPLPTPSHGEQENRAVRRQSSRTAPAYPAQLVSNECGSGATDSSLQIEGDLEMDHIPSDSDPPAYDTLQTSGNLSRHLIGPGSVADTNKQESNSDPASLPKESRQPRPRATGQADSSHTAGNVKRNRTKPSHKEEKSHSQSSRGSEVLNSSRSSKQRTTRNSSVTSSGSKKTASTGLSNQTSVHSISDQGAVAKISTSDGARITTNGGGSVSVEARGNVTINNCIDLRIPFQPPRVPVNKQKSRKKRSPPPAQGSKRRIRTEDIEILSSQLGESWFNIGVSIGVDRGVLENIRAKYPGDQQEMTRQMLIKWTHKYGHKATINYVIDALTDERLDKYDAAMKLPHDRNC